MSTMLKFQNIWPVFETSRPSHSFLPNKCRQYGPVADALEEATALIPQIRQDEGQSARTAGIQPFSGFVRLLSSGLRRGTGGADFSPPSPR